MERIYKQVANLRDPMARPRRPPWPDWETPNVRLFYFTRNNVENSCRKLLFTVAELRLYARPTTRNSLQRYLVTWSYLHQPLRHRWTYKKIIVRKNSQSWVRKTPPSISGG